jgi:hypothetical protein
MIFLASLDHYLSGGFGLISLLLTIFCVVHALRTRQDWWWYLILFFLQPFGALLYLFMVILRGAGQSVTFVRPERGTALLRRRIEELQARLDQTDTIALRSELGQCYLKVKDFDKAEECFESCLTGNFRNDPLLLYSLAQACYGKGAYEKALDALQRTFREDYRDALNERYYLQAKILEGLDRPREALDIYAKIAHHFTGPEFFCRQGLLHKKLGDSEKANAFFMLAMRLENMTPEEMLESKKWLIEAERHLHGKASVNLDR